MQEHRYQKDFYVFAKSTIKGTLGRLQELWPFQRKWLTTSIHPLTPPLRPSTGINWAGSWRWISLPSRSHSTHASLSKAWSKPHWPRPTRILPMAQTELGMGSSTTYHQQITSWPPSSPKSSNLKPLHLLGMRATSHSSARKGQRRTYFCIIALAPVFDKTFQIMVAKLFINLILDNNIIYTTVQKGFLPVIFGCFEHNSIIQEKSSKRPEY